MAKRKRPKRPKQRPRKRVATASYTDSEGNVLVLRKALTPATVERIRERLPAAAASLEDDWQRREEMLFEYLAVSWEIAGLPLDDQKLLLGRYRMAGPEERRWVRETIRAHVEQWIPGIRPGP